MDIRNVTFVSKNMMCSACGACVGVCPTESISFKKSSLGRLYAVVESTCVDCGLCLKVCPSITTDKNTEDYFNLEKKDIVVAKATNADILINGQSGGAVTAILSYLLRTKKIEAALLCRSDVNGDGRPFVVSDESQLSFCQKSSYVQLPLLSEISQLKSYSSVAVVGLPCHLAGLVNILKIKKIPVKYKLGLICDRTLCGTISDGIRRYLNTSDDVVIKWRDKNAEGYSYKNAPISVTMPDGEVRIIKSRVRQKLKGMYTHPRCLVCPDKLNISADLVFGDPWNIHNDDRVGASLVIANNSCGYDLLQEVAQNDLSVIRRCTSEELNDSQHISERACQVGLYSRMLSDRNNQPCFLMTQKLEAGESKMEYLRALFNIGRFKLLEALPLNWVADYTARQIKRLNDE